MVVVPIVRQACAGVSCGSCCERFRWRRQRGDHGAKARALCVAAKKQVAARAGHHQVQRAEGAAQQHGALRLGNGAFMCRRMRTAVRRPLYRWRRREVEKVARKNASRRRR